MGLIQELKENEMTAKTIPQRKDIPDRHTWDLTPLFKSDKPWETVFAEVENNLEYYNKYKGRLKESVSVFKEAIEFHLGLTRKIERLYTYAHLKSDEDKSNQYCLGLHQRALNLLTRSSEMASYMTPEIQSIPNEIITQYMEDASLGELRFYLEKILRYKPHTRSEMEEQILAMSREIANGPSLVFGQLDNVDLKFGTITDDSGNEIELSHGNFTTFLTSPHRELRKKAFFQYYQAYQDHKHTLAATLSNSIKKDFFYSAFYVYKYATGVSAAIALADKVVNGGETARRVYLDFLKLGGSKFPLDELLDAGIDMRSSEPIERAVAHFGDLVDQLIEMS
jgi:oligoendopeptidase F